MPPARVRRPGPGRDAVRADVRAALPHRPPHRDALDRGTTGPTRSAWILPRWPGRSPSRLDPTDRKALRSASSARPTIRPAVSRQPPVSVPFSPWSREFSLSTRLTGSSRHRRRSNCSRPSPAWSWCAPSPRPGPWRASALATRLQTRAWSPRCRTSLFPTTSTRSSRSRGGSPSGSSHDMKLRVAATIEERGRVTEALSGLPVEVWPSNANFILFRVEPAFCLAGLERPARSLRAGSRRLGLARAAGLPACHHRHAFGRRPLPLRVG